MKKIYLVIYNDCYGDGEEDIEGFVETKKEFNEWLKERNKKRKLEGEIEEKKEEFTLKLIFNL